MMRRLTRLTPLSFLPCVLLLAACGAKGADAFSDAIATGAGNLRSSGQTQTTVRWQPAERKPYVVAIYPPFRNAADEAFLDTIAKPALELSHAGAAISPKSEGLLNTVVVWQQGELATFTGAFKSAAEARQALGVVKQDGGPTEITLKREGSSVYVTALR
jgi:hypothetical protein